MKQELTILRKTSAAISGWISEIPKCTKATLLDQCVLVICATVIVSVSIYDTLLVYWFRDSILMDERNPICAALIQEDPNHLTWFYTGKFVGNVTVISVLSFLFRIRFLHARVIAFAVAGFQILLTTYLCFSDPITGLLDFGGLCSHDPLRYRKSVDSLVLHVFAMLVLSSVVIISYFGLQTQRTADRSVQMEPQRRFVGVLR